MKQVHELAQWCPRWTIRKYADDAAHSQDRPYEVSTIDGNLLLNAGITQLLELLGGTGGTAYSNANAQLGVGDGTTAAAATQTALQGTNTAYQAVDTSYPSVAGETITWQATFAGAAANFSWQEFAVLNGASGTGTLLNRLVSNQGTKASGQTWTLQLAVTVS